MKAKKVDRFKKFFKDYSNNVDNANNQYFWRLSDNIILKIINKHIKINTPKSHTILDAGGGTGRWIELLSRKYTTNFILYDFSEDMLKVAKHKNTLMQLSERLKIVQGDIQNMSSIQSSSINYIISIYNPISFIRSPLLFFNEINRVLKPKGKALIMGQGFANAIASKINNYLANSQELKNLDRNKVVKWNSSLAPLNIFSKETFEKLADRSGLNINEIYGIPIFIQPGPEDFDSENKLRSKVSLKLENDPKFYKQIFELEMKYNSQTSMIDRGMNLMIVVQKS